jgi:hypothetical protein
MCSLLYTHAAVPQCHSCCCAAMCHDASLCETWLFHSFGTHPHAQSLPIHVYDMSDTWLIHSLRLWLQRIHVTLTCVTNVWHDAFILWGKYCSARAIWCIHACGMTHSCDTLTCAIHAWHDSYMRDMTHTCVAWLIHTWHDSYMRDMTHTCVTWLIHSPRLLPRESCSVMSRIHMSNVTYSCVWHDSIVHSGLATRILQRTSNMMHPCAWHDSSIWCTYVCWRMCDMTHSFFKALAIQIPQCTSNMTHSCVWHDSPIWCTYVCDVYATWRIHSWRLLPHEYCSARANTTHSCVWHDSFVLCTYVRDTTHPYDALVCVTYVWHDSLIL